MTILSDKLVKTRKPHRCVLCLRNFEPGTMMIRQTNIVDEICTIYECQTCRELMDYVEPNEWNMWYEGEMKEVMDDSNFKGTPEEFLEKCKIAKSSI